MKFRLIPRDESFFPVFIEAADNAHQGAVKLKDMIDTGLGEPEEARKEIRNIEKLGDKFTREIVAKVHKSFVTPFDREDVHELAEGIDDIVDEILNVADVLLLHNVKDDNNHISELAEVLVLSCSHVQSLMRKLSKLKDIEVDLDAISECKRSARKIYRDGVSHLFSGEFKSFDVLKLKDVNESLREAVRQTDVVADIVEAIAVKHT